jgi:hypothetical protein
VVNKPNLKLKGIDDTYGFVGTVIDGNCAASVALDIAADGVQVLGLNTDGIEVTRGTSTEVRIANHRNVKLQNLLVTPALQLPACGTEQNGVEVSGTSTKVKLLSVQGEFMPGAGIYFDGLGVGAGVQLKSAGPFTVTPGGDGNGIGILVQDCASGALLGKSGIEIKKCAFGTNSVAEIRLVNSDGVTIKNSFLGVGNGSGIIGIDLDATSANNHIQSNTWNGGMTSTAFVNDGPGNCGGGNNFTVPPC